jgi:hypothetical protein
MGIELPPIDQRTRSGRLGPIARPFAPIRTVAAEQALEQPDDQFRECQRNDHPESQPRHRSRPEQQHESKRGASARMSLISAAADRTATASTITPTAKARSRRHVGLLCAVRHRPPLFIGSLRPPRAADPSSRFGRADDADRRAAPGGRLSAERALRGFRAASVPRGGEFGRAGEWRLCGRRAAYSKMYEVCATAAGIGVRGTDAGA